MSYKEEKTSKTRKEQEAAFSKQSVNMRSFKKPEKGSTLGVPDRASLLRQTGAQGFVKIRDKAFVKLQRGLAVGPLSKVTCTFTDHICPCF